MEIGEEDRPFILEPLEDPVPREAPAPVPEPVVVPPEREKVPA